MAYDDKFGPDAQSPQQRAYVLAQMQAVLPTLKTNATAYIQRLYARYIAGELSWGQVRELREAPHSIPGSHSVTW
ncbi:hypothetical protein ACW9KT_22145 [Hymenobacter sp. HD11105]